MARIATFLVAAALLSAAASAQAADKPHPDAFLESGSITAGTPQDHPFTSTTKMIPGHWYRVVITGIWTLQFPAVGTQPAYEEEDDAAFCVSKTPPVSDCTYSQHPLDGTADDAARGDFAPAGWLVSPSPNHTYEITFKGPYGTDGLIRFWDGLLPYFGQSGYPTSDSGSYGFQLFGMKEDYPNGAGSGATTTTSPITNDWGKGPGWVVGPVTFRIPTDGYSLSGRKFTYYLQSTTDASVAESVTAYIGGKAYYAGRFGGALKAGKVYVLSVLVRKGAYKAMARALNRGRAVTMRTWFTVESATGNVKKYIDIVLRR